MPPREPALTGSVSVCATVTVVLAAPVTEVVAEVKYGLLAPTVNCAPARLTGTPPNWYLPLASVTVEGTGTSVPVRVTTTPEKSVPTLKPAMPPAARATLPAMVPAETGSVTEAALTAPAPTTIPESCCGS